MVSDNDYTILYWLNLVNILKLFYFLFVHVKSLSSHRSSFGPAGISVLSTHQPYGNTQGQRTWTSPINHVPFGIIKYCLDIPNLNGDS